MHTIGTLVVLSQNGDDRLHWTPSDAKALAAANELFDKLIGRGYLGARMDTPHEGVAIKSFDPSAREIVMTPPVVAG